jgi:hypothetical protein
MVETMDRPDATRREALQTLWPRRLRRLLLLAPCALALLAASAVRAEPGCDGSSAAFDRLLTRKSHDHPTTQGRGAVHWSKIKWTGKQWALAEVAAPADGRDPQRLCIQAGNADVAKTLARLDSAVPSAGMTRDDFKGDTAFVCHVEVGGLAASKEAGCARDVLVEVIDVCEVSIGAEPCPRLEDYQGLTPEQTARYRGFAAQR